MEIKALINCNNSVENLIELFNKHSGASMLSLDISQHVRSQQCNYSPCRKQIWLWTSFCRAVSNIWATLSDLSSVNEQLLSSTTTTGEKPPPRSRLSSALSGTSHSRATTELLDLRRSTEFQFTLRDSQMCAAEKSRKGLQSSTTHPREAHWSRGVLSMWTSSSPVISKALLLEVMA